MNPSDKPCWDSCKACLRCANKGTLAACNTCSGRHDPKEQRDPYYRQDRCRCTEGILQYLTKKGRFIVAKYPNNPFEGSMRNDAESRDDSDWYNYVDEQREMRGDESFDPLVFGGDGSSVTDWMRSAQRGR